MPSNWQGARSCDCRSKGGKQTPCRPICPRQTVFGEHGVAGSVGPNTPIIGTYSSLLIPQTAPVALNSVMTMCYTTLALATQRIIRLWVVFADRSVKTKIGSHRAQKRNP